MYLGTSAYTECGLRKQGAFSHAGDEALWQRVPAQAATLATVPAACRPIEAVHCIPAYFLRHESFHLKPYKLYKCNTRHASVLLAS